MRVTNHEYRHHLAEITSQVKRRACGVIPLLDNLFYLYLSLCNIPSLFSLSPSLSITHFPSKLFSFYLLFMSIPPPFCLDSSLCVLFMCLAPHVLAWLPLVCLQPSHGRRSPNPPPSFTWSGSLVGPPSSAHLNPNLSRLYSNPPHLSIPISPASFNWSVLCVYLWPLTCPQTCVLTLINILSLCLRIILFNIFSVEYVSSALPRLTCLSSVLFSLSSRSLSRHPPLTCLTTSPS